MCTAATYHTKDLYFGRTLDHSCSYGEEIVITPRSYPFAFRRLPTAERHYAMIGVAHIAAGYPLYYDAVNEKGLAIAGLNFTASTVYREPAPKKENVAQFELIPWLLGQCATVQEARKRLATANLIGTPFSAELPTARLHWMIADRSEAVTAECTADGLRIFDNPVGVLTNEPPFDRQLFQLNNYLHLSAKTPRNLFSDRLALHAYSLGMGALGLPGDLSSQSRFVRAAFAKMNAVSGDSEAESVGQFFHILNSVEQARGCCESADGGWEITVYTSCYNADRGICYYTRYDNRQITAVDLHRENLDGNALIGYPMIGGEQIHRQN